jgi:hypothetical protein
MIESATMCRTPAPAAVRVSVRAVASKNSVLARLPIEVVLVASITASIPASAASSPFPVTRSTPADRAITVAS